MVKNAGEPCALSVSCGLQVPIGDSLTTSSLTHTGAGRIRVHFALFEVVMKNDCCKYHCTQTNSLKDPKGRGSKITGYKVQRLAAPKNGECLLHVGPTRMPKQK